LARSDQQIHAITLVTFTQS